jgi:hypothetical protein
MGGKPGVKGRGAMKEEAQLKKRRNRTGKEQAQLKEDQGVWRRKCIMISSGKSDLKIRYHFREDLR